MSDQKYIPLATILRPNTLDEVIGQTELLNPKAPFRKLLEADKLRSFILYGPAGTGKTTLAHLIAKKTKSRFESMNATTASVKEIRLIGKRAVDQGISIVIYMDECHRLSTNQQDVLLPYVEDGSLIFIGATTENPFHSVNSALLSRCLTFQLEPLSMKELLRVLIRGIEWYRHKGKDIQIDTDAAKKMAILACGDGRKMLTILEMAIEVAEVDRITIKTVESIAPSKYMVFSRDMHFDYASCFQGSIQASDPDSAVYWLARWLESGEDPRYIARRLLVSSAEDGFSNPTCIAVAQAAYTAACEVGRPECDIVLSAATIMVATAKRDKSAAIAIWNAVKDVREQLDVVIPKEMKDSHYEGAKKLGHGAYKDGMNQESYVGVNKKYYKPWV